MHDRNGNDHPPLSALTSLQIVIIFFLLLGIIVELGKGAASAGWAEGQAAVQQTNQLPVIGVPATHVELVGIHQKYGHYRLVSFDHGKTWWNISEDRSEITRPLPELVKFAVTMHSLRAYGFPTAGSSD